MLTSRTYIKNPTISKQLQANQLWSLQFNRSFRRNKICLLRRALCSCRDHGNPHRLDGHWGQRVQQRSSVICLGLCRTTCSGWRSGWHRGHGCAGCFLTCGHSTTDRLRSSSSSCIPCSRNNRLAVSNSSRCMHRCWGRSRGASSVAGRRRSSNRHGGSSCSKTTSMGSRSSLHRRGLRGLFTRRGLQRRVVPQIAVVLVGI
jgi:hypothetical protein